MCLLHYLWKSREELGIKLVCAHFDHMLRGEESRRDRRFVENWCKEREIPFVAGEGDVKAFAEENKIGTEEAARRLRYEFLENCAAELNCDKIATAHNADDNAETMLLNLCRGSGLKGLCGIPPVRGKIIRPLLCMSRSDIVAYNEKNAVPHVEDSTNAGDDYSRNLLRHHVSPVLEGINPAFNQAALRCAESLREDDELLCSMADDFISANMQENSIATDALKKLPKPVAVRVFRALCGSGLAAKHCDALMELVNGEGLAYADVPSMRVSRDSGRLYFGAEEKSLGDYELPVNGEVYVPELGATVKTQIADNCSCASGAVYKFDFNYSKVYGSISLTSRRNGDKIRLSYRNCTKSLKELFSEKKLPQNVRNMTPVIRDGEGVIGVMGFGVAQRCEAQPGDTVLRIEIIKKESTGDNLE